MTQPRTPLEKVQAFLELIDDEDESVTPPATVAAGGAPPESPPGLLSEEELDQQLVAAGFDLAEVNARIKADREEALAELAKLEGEGSKGGQGSNVTRKSP